jgi:3-hydroxybutyryl-CoA dehydrogenase
MDLIGLDVNYAVTCSVHRAFFGDPRFQPSQLQRSYVQAGRLGRKTGRGFYRYEDGASKPAPASHRKGEPPTEIVVSGDLGPAQSLIDLAREAGIQVHFSGAPVADGGRVIMGDVVLALTDGRTATERARWEGQPNLAVFDLALDFRTATRVAIAAADSARPLTSDVAAGFFQALGKAVSVIDDTPALVVMRTVSMLANFAADAVHQGVASGADIDIAMKTGTNYPLGLLAWANVVGPARLCQVLGNLSTFYGDGRYRVSPLLQRVAMTGGAFRV